MQADTRKDEKREEQSALVAQLRLDREPMASKSPRRYLWAAGSCFAVMLALAAYLAFVDSGPQVAPVDSASATNVPVSMPVKLPSTPSSLDASGYVVARRQATVSSKITGKVVEVSIEEGQRVSQGQIIAQLDASTSRAAVDQSRAQVEHARASLDALQTALADAQSSFARMQRQVQIGAISLHTFDTEKAAFNARRSAVIVGERALDAAIANEQMARRNLEDTIVRAPFAGLVTEKSAQPGEVVSPVAGGGFTRTGIGTIVDMDSLEIEVDVSENFIDRVSKEQPVTIRLNAYPDWDIEGHVVATIPAADRAKATIKVRVAIDVKDPRIIPNMGARVSFRTPSSAKLGALVQ